MPQSDGGSAQADRTRLKEWLEEGMRWKGWRTPQLAEKSNVSRGTISRLINKKIDPTEGTIEKLAGALDRSLPGNDGSEIVRAHEVLHVLEDAVLRAQAILGGEGEASGETSGPPPNLGRRIPLGEDRSKASGDDEEP